jgi:predicted acyltransferase
MAGLVCNQWLPINKKLWTDSFCLFMAGLDFAVFGAFVWLVDGVGWKRPMRPLAILGMNAITVYMVSEFGAELLDTVAWGGVSMKEHVYRAVFVPLGSPANASLLWALVFTGTMWVVAWVMWRRGWVVRV